MRLRVVRNVSGYAPHISWLKIHDSSGAAVEHKALDKQYEATRSVLTTKGRLRSREE